MLTALHTQDILSTSFSWDGFPTFQKEFLEVLNQHFCLPTNPKPSQLGLGQMMWRPGHLTQHSITPGWSNSSSPAWRWTCSQNTCWSNSAQTRWRMLRQPCWLGTASPSNKSPTLAPLRQHHTSSFTLHGGNHTCRNPPLVFSVSNVLDETTSNS